jgi:putative ABC transport system substrate-binding protein
LSAPAHALGLTVTIITVRDAAGIDAAFAVAARDNVQALFVSQSPFFNTHRVEIAAQAARARLPAIYGFREFADAGGLMSYGPSLPDVYRRFATLVDKILKGASPADLPVEVPTRFTLIINLRAAKAIDLTIPESFLLRADEVIE